MLYDNIYRGFWRLVAVVWMLGAALVMVIQIGDGELKHSPFDEVYDGRIIELGLDPFSDSYAMPEHSKMARWRTQDYRKEVGAFFRVQFLLAILLWVPFYLLSWAFKGFRRDDGET